MSEAVCSLNDRYRNIATETGTTYVDLSGVLSAADGSLRSELTFDGLHLNGSGYRAWVELLRPHLEPLGEARSNQS
jgi:lysophospholipase L1-like esterase